MARKTPSKANYNTQQTMADLLAELIITSEGLQVDEAGRKKIRDPIWTALTGTGGQARKVLTALKNEPNFTKYPSAQQMLKADFIKTLTSSAKNPTQLDAVRERLALLTSQDTGASVDDLGGVLREEGTGKAKSAKSKYKKDALALKDTDNQTQKLLKKANPTVKDRRTQNALRSGMQSSQLDLLKQGGKHTVSQRAATAAGGATAKMAGSAAGEVAETVAKTGSKGLGMLGALGTGIGGVLLGGSLAEAYNQYTGIADARDSARFAHERAMAPSGQDLVMQMMLEEQLKKKSARSALQQNPQMLQALLQEAQLQAQVQQGQAPGMVPINGQFDDPVGLLAMLR